MNDPVDPRVAEQAAEITLLCAEVERLTQELDVDRFSDTATAVQECVRLQRGRDEAQAQVAVLRRYVRHDPECKIDFSKAVQVCTCGLSSALAGDTARALLDRLANPQPCQDHEGPDCDKCDGSGFRCVNCPTYSRAALMWQALLRQARRERDEALAVGRDKDKRTVEMFAQCAAIGKLLRRIQDSDLPAEARALLDRLQVLERRGAANDFVADQLEERLQQAEAVVEAMKERRKIHGESSLTGNERKVLAAWEEETTTNKCPSCGETMDGICHGRSPCNVEPT